VFYIVRRIHRDIDIVPVGMVPYGAKILSVALPRERATAIAKGMR
jgi:hypothetical protein